jgi:UDP-glucose 4-epimerase
LAIHEPNTQQLMNILVTGGAGFIGSTIADAYIKAGHNVVIIDNLSTGQLENVPKASSFYQMDIRDEDVYDIIHQHEVQMINHHAAQIDVRRSVLDPKYDLSVNVLGTLNLIEAGIRQGISRMIFASTGGAIYGEQDYFPADEQHPTNPCSPYGITKLTVEKYLNYYRLEKGLTYTVLRYTNVYGPRQNPHGEAGVVAIFSEKMLRGVEAIINGDGMQTRDYVFVDDVVAANLLALSMEGTDTFNVCTGVESTVVDIFRHLNAALDEPLPERYGPAKPGEQRRSVCTHEKIRAALGWSPTVQLPDGLAQTLRFFRNKFAK